MVRLTAVMLGTGTGVPWRGRSSPGLALAVESGSDNQLALVDPGAGSCQRLVAAGHDLADLTHVLLTHYHPDHCGDLAPLLFALRNQRFSGVGAGAPLRIIGPPGLLRLHAALLDAYGSAIDLGARVRLQEIHPVAGGEFFQLGPLEVGAFPVKHGEGAAAYRFERRLGKTLAYSGDTDVCDGIIDASRNADVLILECSYPEGEKRPGHLIPSEAGKIATAANARRVILTHFYPECWGKDLLKTCREYYRGDVSMAEDGLAIHL